MKNVEEYLNEGIYGPRKPKQAERNHYLGTLRERIVLVLTKGQVMSDKALRQLEKAMQEYPDAQLLVNGHIPRRFYKRETGLAKKYNIPYTSVTNNDVDDSDIGAILTYDYAINKQNIFIDENDLIVEKEPDKPVSFLAKLRQRLFPPD